MDDLRLRDWRPTSQLRARVTTVDRPSKSCIDAHNHLGRWLGEGEWMAPDVGELIDLMDACGVEAMVNLDGRWGAELAENIARYDDARPGRFFTFCHLDWKALSLPHGDRALEQQLREAASRGARGVKVWKDLGLEVTGESGEPVAPDDPRVVHAMGVAGELGLPVLIHTADPIAFFEPLDAHNERLDELRGEPQWWFGDSARYRPWNDLYEAHARLVLDSQGTTFIGAHVGCAAEDLDRVSLLLAQAPNYHVDIAGRLAEIGRQPRRFARFVVEHPDRVLFGTDAYPATREAFTNHYRFLETDDEGFDYAPGESVPPQGRWQIAGAALEPEYLEALYRGNVARILGLSAQR